MDRETYESIYPKLEDLKSVESLSLRYGVPKPTLRVLLTQKIIRETTRKHGVMKKDAKKFRRAWDHGDSFLKISRGVGFPPVMVASIILVENGVSRNMFRTYLKSPNSIKDKRLKKEISEAVENDLVYSPNGAFEQLKRGRDIEKKIFDWLSSQGISFMTEEDCRRENHTKTPDFLLDEPVTFKGKDVCWVESKATFGDYKEFKNDFKKQLRHYVKLFGPGAVVYWYGFLKEQGEPNILFLSRSDIKDLDNN